LTLLGQLIRRIDQRWYAPKFAQRLAPRLVRDYGASKFYTPGQIRAACAKCRLPRRQLALAYAAFLPLPEFENTADVAVRGDYEMLRALFFRFANGSDYSSFTPASMTPGDYSSGVGGGHLSDFGGDASSE
jgi:hypothetical protein